MESTGGRCIHAKPTGPSPIDFEKFIPWACVQFNVNADIIITRSFQSPCVSLGVGKSSKVTKAAKSTIRPAYDPNANLDETSTSSVSSSNDYFRHDNRVYIETIYNYNRDLVQLKFLKNDAIPQIIMKIIGLTIPFHTSLYSIIINSGLRVETVYEMSKILPTSRITEMCLDNTHFIQANYHILLNNDSLQTLSLAKCNLNDDVVKTIASKIQVPSPASKTLSVLNLSTNSITDLGVKYLADALRANRHLSYLNLADNWITDNGATSILNVLIDFALTEPETLDRNAKLAAYLNEKQKLMLKTIKQLQADEFDKRARKSAKLIKHPIVSTPNKSKMLKKDVSALSSLGDTKNTAKLLKLTSTIKFFDRAEVIIKDKLHPLNDPYSLENTEKRNNAIYCYGNNQLCYLNLAYNQLTYFSVKKLQEVVLMQHLRDRKPKGLINVIIEGNLLPTNCTEAQQIDKMLELGLNKFRSVTDKKFSYIKRTS